MEIEYIKSADRVLERNFVNKGGLHLSKEVLWVPVGQRAAELRAVKVGGKKNSAVGLVRTKQEPVPLLPFDLQNPQYLFRKI